VFPLPLPGWRRVGPKHGIYFPYEKSGKPLATMYAVAVPLMEGTLVPLGATSRIAAVAVQAGVAGREADVASTCGSPAAPLVVGCA
jgi:hypothetical protein